MKAIFQKLNYREGYSFFEKKIIQPTFDIQWHFHAQMELNYVICSEGTRYVGNSVQRFQAHDLVLLAPRLPHCWFNDYLESPDPETAQGIFVVFQPNLLGDEFFQAPELTKIRRLFEQARLGVHFSEATGRLVGEKLESLMTLQGFSKLLKFLEILSDLSDTEDSEILSNPGFDQAFAPPQENRIETVFQYVLSHLHQPILQTDVAELIHMTSVSFSRFFKNSTGKTFKTFVNESRISKACHLLIDTDDGITDVAYQCGFENLSNFNRCFQKYKNTTPTLFRETYTKRLVFKEDAS